MNNLTQSGIRKGGKNKKDKFWCSKHQVVHSLINQYPSCKYPNLTRKDKNL